MPKYSRLNPHRRPFAIVLALVVLGLLGACEPLVPATTPPQLAHTPGAWFVVAENRLNAGPFQLDYPPNWRIVKESVAASTFVQLVLVAPEGGIVTLVQAAVRDPLADHFLALDNGINLNIYIVHGEQPTDTFDTQVKRLVASVRG